MNRLGHALLTSILLSATLAGCINDTPTDAIVEDVPCEDHDVACLCEGEQSCIDDRTDTDGDGLTDSHEFALGTEVNNTDTDNDGVADGDEVDAGTNPRIPWYPNGGNYTYEYVEVESGLPHMIPVSIFRPDVATPETPVPVLLHSHGFTGQRWDDSVDVSEYMAAGFAVVSFDERGHHDAYDSEVMFMHPDAEVQDVIDVIDYIATLDWVLRDLDDPNDPVLGTIGASYGGAFQLMTRVFDDRIDAMVPEITWYDIVEALAPNGAIKSGWVDLFYLAGNGFYAAFVATNGGYDGGGVHFSNDFHAGFAWATGTNELPAGQAPGVPDLVTLFQEASPAYHDGGLDVPTLLIQGMPDTLFPLNQAVWNYQRLQENGAPVHLYTHLQGHIAPGLQGSGGGFPCGEVDALNILWHQAWLLDLPVDTGDAVCISLEDGSAIVGDSFPLPSTDATPIAIDGPFPIAQGAGGGNAVPLHTITADSDMVVAGIPRLKGTIISPGPDAIVYFSFYRMNTEGALEHIVDDQVRPLRVQAPANTGMEFDMELGGIATRLAEGEEMVLMVSSFEPMYFGNTERLPSGVVLQDLELELPVVNNPVPLS